MLQSYLRQSVQLRYEPRLGSVSRQFSDRELFRGRVIKSSLSHGARRATCVSQRANKIVDKGLPPDKPFWQRSLSSAKPPWELRYCDSSQQKYRFRHGLAISLRSISPHACATISLFQLYKTSWTLPGEADHGSKAGESRYTLCEDAADS